MMKLRSQQTGHVMAEYVAVTIVMVIALFAPIPGTDQSAVAMLMESIRGFHANSSFLLSLP